MKLNRISTDISAFRDIEPVYEGSRYTEVKHGIVHDTIREELDKLKLNVVKEKFLSDAKGQKLISVIDLGRFDSELNYSIAWRNSLDGTRSFSVVAGTIVNVCSNSNIWGNELEYTRKHTGDAVADIVNHVQLAVNSLASLAEKHAELIAKVKYVNLGEAEIAQAIGSLYLYDNIVNTEQLQIIKRELQEPSFSYGTKANNLWTLYNHVTHALKNCHPGDFMRKHVELHDKFLKKWS